MDKIDLLREELYFAIEIGNETEVLKISEILDVEIVEYMKATILMSDHI